MLHQYEPNVKATIKFLRLLKLKVNASTVNETLQNHPDWPSLLCISDSLNKWNIPNGAGKIDVAKINELPTPFIAYTNNSENPLAIVTGVAPTTVTLFQKKYTTLSIIAKDEFLKTWNGMIRQYSEAKTTEVPAGRDGMYFKEFSAQSDWMHHGEGLQLFNRLALSAPAAPRSGRWRCP